jgi:uncharacterized protein (DUF2267 family)
MEDMNWGDNRQRAYRALRATLHALRDRMTLEETADFGAQLPMLVRGFYYEGWHPAHKPVKERHKEQFLSHLAESLKDDPALIPEDVARAVFRLLQQRITEGEISDVKGQLPKDIQTLWPS